MIDLQLTQEETELLSGMVDWWAGGLSEAEQDTLVDPSIIDVDQYLVLVDGMQEQKVLTDSLQRKLKEALDGSGTYTG